MTNSMIKLLETTDAQEMAAGFKQIELAQAAIQKNLKRGHDYGEIGGTNKPTLLKPGAEKVLMMFGLKSEYEIMTQIEDWQKGIFSYTVKCTLSKGDEKITEGLGSCNNQEDKYKYRWAYDNEIPEGTDLSTLKTNGRGKYRVLNDEPWSLVNTILKMAKKRAQIDATLTVASLSEIFTQDLEDIADFESREATETMNEQDAGKRKLSFGKYKGMTYEEVFRQDPGYLKWIADNARNPIDKKAAEHLLANGVEAKKTPPEKEEEAEPQYDINPEEIPF